MKNCSECKQVLPKTMFHKATREKDGLSYMCKSCRSKTRKVPEETKIRNKAKRDLELIVNSLSDVDAAYIAGLLDGEGNISLLRNHSKNPNRKNRTPSYVLRLSINNTFPGIVEWVQMKVGHGRVYLENRSASSRKQSYRWSITGRRCLGFLREVYPYLKIKKLQAEVAFTYGRTISYSGHCKLNEEVIVFRDELRRQIIDLNG